MKMKAKIENIVEIFNHDTNEKEFLLLNDDGDWVPIDEETYNRKIEGEK